MASLGMNNFDFPGRSMVKYNMGQVVRSICSQTGIQQCIHKSFIKVDKYTSVERTDSSSMQSRLYDAAQSVGITLTGMQKKSVFNTVWRPITDIVVSANGSMVRAFKSPNNDVGSPVLMDLPTGMGKTLVCTLSSLLLCTERCFGLSMTMSMTDGSRTSVVFCPKHLHGQWMREALKAKSIVESMYTTSPVQWKVRVYSNKKASEIELLDNEVAIIVSESSNFGPRKILENDKWYASICYDECCNPNPSLNSSLHVGIGETNYGRIILCSSDFSRMASTFLSSPERCAMKIALGVKDVDLGIIMKGVFPRSCMSKDEVYSAMKSMSVLYASQVLPGTHRESILEESCDVLGNTGLYTVRIPYIANTCGSPVTGFRNMLKVNISTCCTVGDVTHKLSGESNERMIEDLKALSLEDCPVCLNKKETSCILAPCFHMVCGKCIETLVKFSSSSRMLKCPMCRGEVQRSITVLNTMEVSKSRKIGDMCRATNNCTVGDVFFHVVSKTKDVKLGVSETVGSVLDMLKISNDINGGGTLRVLLVSSSPEEIDVDGLKDYDVMNFSTKGTREEPCTLGRLESVLDDFQKDDGRCKLLTFGKYTDVTGLDFPTVQAVISVGSKGREQKIGRVCRLPRMGFLKKQRDVIYVELFQ